MKKTLILSSIFCFIARFKMSTIIGSHTAHFSALAVVGPIIGLQTTFTQLIISFGGFGLWTLLHCNTVNSMMLVYHVPSFMGMAYNCLAFSNSAQKSFKTIAALCAALIPALCIIIFCTHTVGEHAWPYALLWILPIILPLRKHQSFFRQTLASTLACHAVGSVIWLYTHNLTAQQWLALTPVTCIERLAIATVSTGIWALITYFNQHDLLQQGWNKISLWIKLKISPYRL